MCKQVINIKTILHENSILKEIKQMPRKLKLRINSSQNKQLECVQGQIN